MGELIFNQETHTYTKDSWIYPSVTQALKGAGLIDTTFFTEEKRDIGTGVHMLTAMYDTDTLKDFGNISEGYLDAWIKFLKETGFKIDKIEIPMCSDKHMFAGTPDRLGWLSKYGVLEIKATEANYPYFAAQTGGYEILANENFPKNKIKERNVVHLSPDGKYKITKHENNSDKFDFLACLRIHNLRVRHKMGV